MEPERGFSLQLTPKSIRKQSQGHLHVTPDRIHHTLNSQQFHLKVAKYCPFPFHFFVNLTLFLPKISLKIVNSQELKKLGTVLRVNQHLPFYLKPDM